MGEVPKIVLLGGGGHARVLIDAIRASGETRSIGILDADPVRTGSLVLGIPIVGEDLLLGDLACSGTKAFAVAMGGTRGARDNGPRSRLFEYAVSLGLEPLSICHPSAVVSVWAVVGPGSQILPGAIVNAGTILGRNVIVNSGAVVEHDCTIGDHAHIATGACLASTVTVGHHAHVGAGAVVRQMISIGAEAVVGAGAVVVKNVESATVVAGVPAKELGT